ncbi:2-succinyl-5-enolpyruvyl-6-hydroxy-3-cyclohexene-1-carboxylic-acid synthase [Halovivax cerinus]|uniref:2-succinyl-5-enolpyruvyl-6-hydroxy-3-cyclohexene-1-carboxylate synthase n=1 Tax=Halovivax cerinus TaxID=1487865 RepID=A0ABD5NRX8_9EURY|nr:2-succinyl-5-enolpyruvyl-6-hydroxy-3-cyclohexene-1-carboxylic-acid synthase [Halovivax cerinus]
MTDVNPATLWGRTIVSELAAGGLEHVCIAPGSRSTPLTAAFAAHEDVTVHSHLDERSAGFYALGRGRRTSEPTALVCTSGTAAANVHPAVIEADTGRVPLLVLTADRPAELADSGANQTIDQTKLYGDSVRWYAQLPEPVPNERTLASVRTTVARALGRASDTPSGPVHLNCPFAKPLDPDPTAEPIPREQLDPLLEQSRNGPYVSTTNGTVSTDSDTVDSLVDALEDADRPLFVAGPADPEALSNHATWRDPLVELAESIGAPILADPLSAVRFGPGASSPTVCGGYDAYVDALPDPDCVVRIGASPTSKRLRRALKDANCRQFVVDPAGSWREATFSATDLVVAAPSTLLPELATRVGARQASTSDGDWLGHFTDAERTVDEAVDRQRSADALASSPVEGSVLATVLERAPDPSTVFVSNSMPIRDADLFGRPREASLTVLANRGASGIDGIVSTALGAGSATDDPLTLVTGDLAFYHDSNGLLALSRCPVDATIVLVHNDGGGIFHKLPIEAHDPPFTAQFKTPHGLDFEPFGSVYGFDYVSADPETFERTYANAVSTDGTTVVAVHFDAASSHRRRETLLDTVTSRVSE